MCSNKTICMLIKRKITITSAASACMPQMRLIYINSDFDREHILRENLLQWQFTWIVICKEGKWRTENLIRNDERNSFFEGSNPMAAFPGSPIGSNPMAAFANPSGPFAGRNNALANNILSITQSATKMCSDFWNSLFPFLNYSSQQRYAVWSKWSNPFKNKSWNKRMNFTKNIKNYLFLIINQLRFLFIFTLNFHLSDLFFSHLQLRECWSRYVIIHVDCFYYMLFI